MPQRYAIAQASLPQSLPAALTSTSEAAASSSSTTDIAAIDAAQWNALTRQRAAVSAP
jgi:hypothetical protein